MTAPSDAVAAQNVAVHIADLIARAVTSSLNAVVITEAHDPDCPIVFANEAFCRLSGYSPQELSGAGCHLLLHVDRSQPPLSRLREVIARGDSASAVMRMRRKDGLLFWSRLHLSPVADGAGKVTHYIWIHAAMHAAAARMADLGPRQRLANTEPVSDTARAKLAEALHSAIQRQELSLVYQPLVDLQSGEVAGLEALLRWSNPELGEVPTTQFIPIAEESGTIEAIGEWALRRACEDMRGWLENGMGAVNVAVNVSPRQFDNLAFAEMVEQAIHDAGIDPAWLSLEITENLLMQDDAARQAAFSRLRALGVGLVLDDFGTGYSSLGYLKRFRFDKVKIDRSFIDNVASSPDDGAIAKAVISMAHSLGIRVVAEGVETELQCDFLRRNMCDEIQGYLFARPMPAAEVQALLREGRRLSDHLLRLSKPQRTLLIVDDEANILSALKRLLRRDNYTVLTANSGPEGLEVLKMHAVDVIISDQRMPGMTGVEFLGKAKELWPDTVRIVLSGYTELQSVTDAVNQGAVYKFLTKPWDDVQLRGHIEEAFRRKEMEDENRRLTREVQTANFELAAANRRLGDVLDQQQQQIRRDEISLEVVREMMRNLPIAVLGLDEEDCIAFANSSAQALFRAQGLLLGRDAASAIPALMLSLKEAHEGQMCRVRLDDGTVYRAVSYLMGQGSDSRGRLVTLTPEQETQ